MGNSNMDGIFEPFKGDIFHFNCHKAIACFNKCCAKLNLALTPYDVLRMKNRLSIPSDLFLDRYTVTKMEKQKRFPTVRLKMDDTGGNSCPFVSPSGCEIYEDRPGACRIYPLGRASAVIEGIRDTKEKFFMVKEPHCLGFQEEKSWTIDQWLGHEGLEEYHTMNDLWLEIVSSKKSLGQQGDATKKIQMFFMVSYNLDLFRRFLFESKFFKRFDVSPALIEKMASDDVELMKFGFSWLKFSLFGEKNDNINMQS